MRVLEMLPAVGETLGSVKSFKGDTLKTTVTNYTSHQPKIAIVRLPGDFWVAPRSGHTQTLAKLSVFADKHTNDMLLEAHVCNIKMTTISSTFYLSF